MAAELDIAAVGDRGAAEVDGERRRDGGSSSPRSRRGVVVAELDLEHQEADERGGGGAPSGGAIAAWPELK